MFVAPAALTWAGGGNVARGGRARRRGPGDVAAPVSPTPPMGWSSWSALREGSGLTQDGIKAQARSCTTS
ncbi:hypothetical protein ACRAWF_40595 [Streptomyces sp. L7]